MKVRKIFKTRMRKCSLHLIDSFKDHKKQLVKLEFYLKDTDKLVNSIDFAMNEVFGLINQKLPAGCGVVLGDKPVHKTADVVARDSAVLVAVKDNIAVKDQNANA